VGQLWVHSDWHRHHYNIYKFTYTDGNGVERRVRERFANATEGDAYIEQRIRDLVKDGDTILFLGDLCMNRKNDGGHEFAAFFRGLPGKKWLIPGNHDQLYANWYIDAGFRKIRGSFSVDGILFSHYPLHESSLYRAKVNAHGHIHQNPSPSGPYFNCCVEVNNYEPIPIETIKGYADSLKANGNPKVERM
jgi:calcineurin-like phosphoesterase family protein